MTECIFCRIDADGCPEDERRMAYFIFGASDDEGEFAPCSRHKTSMLLGLATFGEILGQPSTAMKSIRAIANIRLVEGDET